MLEKNNSFFEPISNKNTSSPQGGTKNWYQLFQRDFPYRNKAITFNPDIDYEQLYRVAAELRRRGNETLSQQQQYLFKWIRANDATTIKKYPWDVERDFIEIFDEDWQIFPLGHQWVSFTILRNAVSLASLYKRRDILDYFYQEICNQVFANNDFDKRGRTKAYWAAACGMTSEISSLDKNVSPNPTDMLTTLLFVAIRHGHLAVVQTLITQGASINAIDSDGATPLFVAAQNDQIDILKILIKAGAPINQVVRMHEITPLYISAKLGHLEVVKILMTAGAEINKGKIVDFQEETPLYAAAQSGHLDIVEVLLSAGADPDQSRSDGETPLHAAAYHGYTDIVQALLKANSNAHREPNQKTVFNCVLHGSKNPKIIKMLLDTQADVNTPHELRTPLYYVVGLGNLALVKSLLLAGANVDDTTTWGDTPLHYASENGKIEIVKTLLNAGAKTDVANMIGNTPLHDTCQNGHIEIVDILLAAGADFDRANNKGKTPLYIATHKGHHEIAQTLLHVGANVHSATVTGITPLHIASFKSDFVMVEILVEAGAKIDEPDSHGMTPTIVAQITECQEIFSFFKLWETKIAFEKQSLLEQIIAILEVHNVLNDLNLIDPILLHFILKLKTNKKSGNDLDATTLAKILDHHKSLIPSEKFDFIFEYLLGVSSSVDISLNLDEQTPARTNTPPTMTTQGFFSNPLGKRKRDTVGAEEESLFDNPMYG